jgi:hypothetical protein
MYYLLNNRNGLGNRIYCVINIMYEALLNNQKINLENFYEQNGYYRYDINLFFDIKKIEDSFNQQIINENTKDKKDLFFPKDMHRINKRLMDISQYFVIADKYIKPNLNKKIFEPLNERICLMHIRSGDEFITKNNCTHPIYVLPPLAYYKKIIDEYDDVYDKFIIMTEPDLLNPCIQPLKEYSNKVEIRCNSANEDFVYFLRAQSIVLSWSTFSDIVVYLSPNLKNLFFWNDSHVFSDKSVLPKNLNVKSLILTKPYIERGKWNGLDKNIHKKMVEYKVEDVIFET